MSKVLTGPAPSVFNLESCNLSGLSLREAKREIDRRLLEGECAFPADLARGDTVFHRVMREYAGRSADILSGGYSESPVAIFGDGEKARELAEGLRKRHVCCDVYPISDLEPSEDGPRTQGDVLRIGKCTYRMAVIMEQDATARSFEVFDTLPLPETSTHMGEKLHVLEFQIYRVPEERLSDTESEAQSIVSDLIGKKLHECIVTPDSDYLRYYHYELSGASVYFVCNQGTKEFRGRLIIEHPMRNAANSHHEKNVRRLSLNTKAMAPGVAYTFDSWSGIVDRADYMDGSFSMTLEPGKSIFLILDRTISSLDEIGRALPKDYLDLFHCRVVRMEEDWSAAEDGGSGASRAVFEAENNKRYFLEIADADGGVECFVNGESMGVQILPAFWFDLKKGVKPGRNELLIEVMSEGGSGKTRGIRLIEFGV